MTNLFNRWLPGATLLAWSSVLLAFYFTGRVASFLHPTFRPSVLLAGLVMLAMGGCFLFLPGVASCCDDDRCGHPLGRRKTGRLLTFLILLAPLGCAAMFSPNQYGAATILNRGIVTDAAGLTARSPAARPPVVAATAAAADNPSEPPLPTKDGSQPAAAAASPVQASQDDFLPKTKDGNLAVQVIDLLYAAQDTSLRSDFAGKTVETIGQVMPDDTNNASGSRFKLMRMFMVCCAADAKPIAALVEMPQKPTAPEMAWVKVIGKVEFPVEGGRTVPVLKATSVKQTDPPEETMLY